jgi:hypothetical protein
MRDGGMIDCDIKDRREEVEYLRIILAMAEFGVSYVQADLINRCVKLRNEKGGDAVVSDGVDVFWEWKRHWNDYATMKEKGIK